MASFDVSVLLRYLRGSILVLFYKQHKQGLLSVIVITSYECFIFSKKLSDRFIPFDENVEFPEIISFQKEKKIFYFVLKKMLKKLHLLIKQQTSGIFY